jgi:hypothetical protein
MEPENQFNPMSDGPYPATRFVGYTICIFLLGWCSHEFFKACVELISEMTR